MKPRVLLITRNLPPLLGGMERLNLHLAKALANWGELSVIGPTGCRAHLPFGIEVTEIPPRPLPLFLMRALWAVWRLARKRPAIVIAGSGLTAPLAWFSAQFAGARSVVYLHGLDLIVPSRLYQLVWLPFIRHCDVAIVNSRNTHALAMDRGVKVDRVRVIHPGTDLPIPDPESASRFRERHKLGDHPVLLSVGRLTPRKGLAEFVRDALPIVLAQHPDVLLLVIGADANDAVVKASVSERQRIIDFAQQADVMRALRLIPPCDNATLSAAYRAADVHVFPVREIPGDVEGFGMVAIEAAAHGLPTVAFNVGGVADAVTEGLSGNLVVADNYVGFAGWVSWWLDKRGDNHVSAECVTVATAFSWDHFNDQINSLLLVTNENT